MTRGMMVRGILLLGGLSLLAGCLKITMPCIGAC